MKAGWFDVIFLWGAMIAVLIVVMIPEMRKTPEQRKKEAQMVRERFMKKREEEKNAQQEVQDNAPAKGCLQNMMEYTILSLVLLISVIVLIIVIAASGH